MMQSIPEDPYAFARVSVMKSMLLDKSYYDKLLKMQQNEIIKTLQDKGYAEDISAVDSRYKGSALVERALAKNLERTYKKLKRITNEQLSYVIQIYLDRNDSWNVRNVLRGIQSGRKEGVEELLLPVGRIKKEELLEMLKKTSVKDVISHMKIFGKNEFSDLSEAEDFLTKKYYENAMKEAESLPEQGESMRGFIMAEIRTINIMTVMKMKAANIPQDAIEKRVIGPKESLIKTLIAAPNIEACFEILSKTDYKPASEEGKKNWQESGKLTGIETALYRQLLRKNLSAVHKDILSPNLILGYLFAKQIEAKNIRLISKGKELGIDPAFVEKELIIA